jgi:serine/threonine protein kinase
LTTAQERVGSHAGRFLLRSVLGEGGMGAVYRGYDAALDAERAIKVLNKQLCENPTIVQRFQNEARAASRLHKETQHIIRVDEIGTLPGGEAFIAMELLHGASLETFLADRGRLTIHDALWIIAQVAVGLDVAHTHAIIHRDLKPANIFITADDNNPWFAKILDFGIARFRDDRGPALRTEVGAVMGTPAYMAAELFLDATNASVASDVYALAAILFQLVTGRLPFEVEPGSGLPAFYFAQQGGRPQRPEYLAPALFDVITTGLAFEARARPKTARDYILAVASVVEAEPPFALSGAEILGQIAKRLLQAPDAATVKNRSPDPDRMAALVATPTPHSTPRATPPPVVRSPASELAEAHRAAVLAGGPMDSRSPVTESLGPRVAPVARPTPITNTSIVPQTPVSIPNAVPIVGGTTLSAASGAVMSPPPPSSAPSNRLWMLLGGGAAIAIGASAAIALGFRGGSTGAKNAPVASSPTVTAVDAAPPVQPIALPSTSASIAIDAAGPVMGTLVIDTEPAGAALSVDGVEVGTTPRAITRPIGTTVTVGISLRGYASETHAIEVSGRETRTSYDLHRRKGASSPSRDGGTAASKVTDNGTVAAPPTTNKGSATPPSGHFDPDDVGGK